MWVDFNVKGKQGMDFFYWKEALLKVMDCYFGRKHWFEVKNFLMMDLFPTNTQLLSSQGGN